MTTSRAPRVLIFAPAFPPLGNPEAHTNGNLALALLDAGWDVAVISRALERRTGYNYGNEWAGRWGRLEPHTVCVEPEVCGTLKRAAETAIGAARTGHLVEGCRWAAKAAGAALALDAERPFDLVISRSGPDSAHLAAMAFTRREGVPWIANWNDAFGKRNLPPYGEGPRAWVGLRNARFLRQVARRAGWHTFPSERLRRYISGYLGLDADKPVSVIPHVAVQTETAAAWQNVGTLTLCHAGNLSVERDPKNFLSALSNVCGDPGISADLRFIHVGLESVNLRHQIHDRGLEKNVILMEPRDYEACQETLRNADVLVLLEAQLGEGIYLPAKFASYVEARRPILAVSPRIGTAADLLGRHGGGLAVDCASVDSIEAGLRKLHVSWASGALAGDYPLENLALHFSPGRVAAIYGEIGEILLMARNEKRAGSR